MTKTNKRAYATSTTQILLRRQQAMQRRIAEMSHADKESLILKLAAVLYPFGDETHEHGADELGFIGNLFSDYGITKGGR